MSEEESQNLSGEASVNPPLTDNIAKPNDVAASADSAAVDNPPSPAVEPAASSAPEVPIITPPDEPAKPADAAINSPVDAALSPPVSEELPSPPLDNAAIVQPTEQDVSVLESASLENNQSAASSQPASASAQPPASQTSPPEAIQPAPASAASKFAAGIQNWKQHLQEALAKKRQRKQTKQIQVLALAEKYSGVVTNKQVQKALRCTQLTAYRYLSVLEKQGKLKRVGGHNTPKYELVK